MPKKLQKSLRRYLSKLKKPTPHLQFPSNAFSSSTSRILSGCRYPKTPSFNRNETGECTNKYAATLSDIDRFLVENFRSLYRTNDNEDHENSETGEEDSCGEFLFGSPQFIDMPSNICDSPRFFVSAGPSSSLIEEARMSITTSEGSGSRSSTSTTLSDSIPVSHDMKDLPLPDDCIAVIRYSPNPYDDFRRSMQEMIEARFHNRAKVDWDFMEELLFCYLNLNEKKSYRYILSAFVDLVVVLRQNSGKVPARSQSVGTAGERRRKSRDVT